MNNPADCIPIIPLDLRQRVKLSLEKRAPELGRLSVEVVWPGTVHLTGNVRSPYMRRVALETAGHVAGVWHVIDGIRVLRIEPSVPRYDAPFLSIFSPAPG